MRSRCRALARALLFLTVVVAAPACATAQRAAEAAAAQAGPALPTRITDEEFWGMVNGMSEPGGFFRSDNFVSNEITFQYVLPRLTRTIAPDGVYLGVGPDQNFTYIVGLKPRVAFVVDIRRQNMLQHLMYKALIELSPTREEFLSRLFSRRGTFLPNDASPDSLLAVVGRATPDSTLYWMSLNAIRFQLTRVHRFALSPDDSATIEYVYGAFFDAGPDLTYSFATGRGSRTFFGRRMPTYGQLMVENDGAGVQRSYLASEENYGVLRRMQLDNRIVPLVGDFAGEKALRAVGDYVRAHGATVSALYTSNVEQYLFQQADDWRRFYANVATLPIDGRSTFIRAVFNYLGMRDPSSLNAPTPGPRSSTMLQPIGELLRALREGQVTSYFDVIQLSAMPAGAGPP